MIRYTLLTLLITFLCVYSFKDWFKVLCVLVALLAVIEHPDWPKSLMGIQGANPWNLLLLFVLMGRAYSKKNEPQLEKLPAGLKFLLITYFTFVVISVLRMMSDTSGIVEWAVYTNQDPPSTASLISEHIINSFKWLIPGYLMYTGCNSEKRLKLGLVSIAFVYVFLALQIIKAMPIGSITRGDELEYLARRILSSNVGFHRVNLSMMMSGAFWAIYAFREILNKKMHVYYLYGICLIVFYGQALTG